MPELKEMLEKLHQHTALPPIQQDGYFYLDSNYGEYLVVVGEQGMGPHFHLSTDETLSVEEGRIAVVVHGQAEEVWGSMELKSGVVHQILSLDDWALIKISTPGTQTLQGDDTYPVR